jgi:hypothetical protein
MTFFCEHESAPLQQPITTRAKNLPPGRMESGSPVARCRMLEASKCEHRTPFHSCLSETVDCDRRITAQPIARLLGILLEASTVYDHQGYDVLRPLWVEEAMHRSYSLLRLCLILQYYSGSGVPTDQLGQQLDLAIATDLAAVYQELKAWAVCEMVPCSQALRCVTTNLAALFGNTACRIQFSTDIEPLSLPGFQGRALILAASELVINSLLHAFRWRKHGYLRVELRTSSANYARLRVIDDGIGINISRTQVECGIAGGLAGLLATSLSYRCRATDGTIAEIAFDPDCDRRTIPSRKSPDDHLPPRVCVPKM